MPYRKPYRAKKRTYKKRAWKNNNTGNKKRFRKTYNRNTQNRIKTYIDNPFPASIMTRQNCSQSGVVLTQSAIGAPEYDLLCKIQASGPWQQSGLTSENVQYHRIYTSYYDKWMAHYAVLQIRVHNTGSDDCKVVLGLSDDQTQVTDLQSANVNIDEAGMLPFTQSKILESDGGSRYNRGTFNFKINITKWIKRMGVNPAQAYGNLNAGVVPQLYPILWMAFETVDGANPAKVNVTSKMTLYNRYFERQDDQLAKGQ